MCKRQKTIHVAVSLLLSYYRTMTSKRVHCGKTVRRNQHAVMCDICNESTDIQNVFSRYVSLLGLPPVSVIKFVKSASPLYINQVVHYSYKNEVTWMFANTVGLWHISMTFWYTSCGLGYGLWTTHLHGLGANGLGPTRMGLAGPKNEPVQTSSTYTWPSTCLFSGTARMKFQRRQLIMPMEYGQSVSL